jgi:DNA-directed RNA polymerase subunit RPC12/RpoP
MITVKDTRIVEVRCRHCLEESELDLNDPFPRIYCPDCGGKVFDRVRAPFVKLLKAR